LLSARKLLPSAGALLSTSAAKLSLPRDCSDLPDFDGDAPWKVRLGTGSVVTLGTGGLSGMKLDRDQQVPGHPEVKKIDSFFNWLPAARDEFRPR
jgi:hypothetical protein